MNEYLALRERLRGRVEALLPERRAVFALACAEHVMSPLEASDRQTELRAAVARGFGVLGQAPGELEGLHATLSGRDDVDEEEVAAVTLALGAVMGLPDNAGWAASRALDAAFALVPHPSDATTFRSLQEDTLTQPCSRRWPGRSRPSTSWRAIRI